jgi:RHS repeat-associated protein
MLIYDANGNQTSGAGLTATWTSFNMPSTLASSVGTSSFTYGPEHQRTKQTWTSPTSPTTNSTTVYLFDLPYEKVTSTSSGITAHRQWLSAGSERRILVTRSLTATNVASEDTKYLHPDRLGSTSVVTSSAGTVTERQLYDPWGDRRNVNGTGDPNNSLMPQIGRGFTGHEHLDQGFLGLIHMNGRVYDPALGRFLSPDPFVQSPYSTQSHQRYSYVSNNPLNATDPSGYLTIIQLNSVLPSTVGSLFGGMGLGSFAGFESTEPSKAADEPKCSAFMAGCRTYYVHEMTDYYQSVDGGPREYRFTVYGATYNISMPTSGTPGFGVGAGFLPLPPLIMPDPRLTQGLLNKVQQYARGAFSGAKTLFTDPKQAWQNAVENNPWLGLIFNESSDSVQSNVRENKAKGDKAEDEVANDLKGEGKEIDRQVRKDTPFGTRVIDIEVKGQQGGIEVNSGNSRYPPDQRSKDEWLRQNGYPVDLIRKP